MDNELIVLRILHIVPGALWVGAAVITVFIIEPTLTSAGPEVMKQVGPRLAKPLAIFFSSIGILTIVVGLVLVDRAPGHDYDERIGT